MDLDWDWDWGLGLSLGLLGLFLSFARDRVRSLGCSPGPGVIPRMIPFRSMLMQTALKLFRPQGCDGLDIYGKRCHE